MKTMKILLRSSSVVAVLLRRLAVALNIPDTILLNIWGPN